LNKQLFTAICFLPFAGMIVLGQISISQTKQDSAVVQQLEKINRMLELATMHQEITTLDSVYSEDFIFTHGSGNVQTKSQWLASVSRGKTRYLSRELDSIAVELHGDVAVVLGRTIIHSTSTSRDRNYGIRFVRVFALRENRWQLLSHRTIAEWDVK